MVRAFHMQWAKLVNLFRPKAKIRRIPTLSTPLTDEEGFLSGKHSRFYETLRVLRIAIEFIRGFWTFHFVGPAITVFGSARFKSDHHYYLLAEKIGAAIAKEGFVTVTGGGPGIMEATNKGAQQAGGLSIGANILLPHEQGHNAYLDQVKTFYYFFVRKVILVKYSYAFVVLPGGFGTMDELTEALTLIQTGKLYDFPVFLVGKDYWKGLLDWIENTVIPNGTIKKEDLRLLTVTDDVEEIQTSIRQLAQKLRLPVTSNS